MSEPEQQNPGSTSPDLRAQIRARIAVSRHESDPAEAGRPISVADLKASYSVGRTGSRHSSAAPPESGQTGRRGGRLREQPGQHNGHRLPPSADAFGTYTPDTADTLGDEVSGLGDTHALGDAPASGREVTATGLPTAEGPGTGRVNGYAVDAGPGLRTVPTRPTRSAGGARHRRQAQAPTPPTHGQRLLRLVMLLVLTAVAVVGLRTFVIASYYIPSASMETTLHGCPGCQPDMVLVDKLSYRFRPVSRTDVIVFNRPPLAPPEDKQLIKRVIGLPGDTISGHNGHVFIGNRELLEPYLNPACHGTADFAPVKVPAGDYFMMGDNRCDSFDSRMFGPVPRSAIIGRAFAVIWPTKHLRWL